MTTTTYTPTHKLRIVTAAALFDGHDAAINIMRRIMQASGTEVIHLGHNRSAQEIVNCAIQEDAQAIAITSYQGGHIEFFKYIYDLLKEQNCQHIKVFGGGGGNNDQSNTVYMPMGAALKLKPNADDLFILAIAREGQLEKAKDDVQDLLRIRRQVPFGEKNNFAMETAASLIDQFAAISNGVFIAMIVISSVGLMIGGIGVMNIMLVSVTERTREIGIRKAIGAKQKDILMQFLIEAATLTGFGGLVGLLIGYGISLLIRIVFPSYVPYWAPPLGFGASVLIGLAFGLFPAWKAARLDPIESLRYE